MNDKFKDITADVLALMRKRRTAELIKLAERSLQVNELHLAMNPKNVFYKGMVKNTKELIQELEKHDNTIQEPKNVGKNRVNSDNSNHGVLFTANVLRDCSGGVLCSFCSPESCVGNCTVKVSNS